MGNNKRIYNCTCAATGEKGKTNEFYKAPNGKYYKSEELYQEILFERDCRDKVFNIIFHELFNMRNPNSHTSLFLKLFGESGIKASDLYEYLQSNKNYIKEHLPYDDCTVSAKLFSIFTLFKNTIGKVTYAGCYEIRNKETNGIYIGESVDLFRRFTEHISDLYENKHHCIKLQEVFNLTKSMDNFTIKPLCVNPIVCADKMKIKEETLYMESAYYLMYKNKNYVLYNTINPYEALKNDNVFVKDNKVNCKNVLTLLCQDKYHILDKETLNFIKDDLKNIIGINALIVKKPSANKNIIEKESSKKIPKSKTIKNNTKEINELIKQGEKFYTITSIFKSLAEQGIIPNNYDIHKLKEVLEENNLIRLQPFDKFNRMIATNYALDEKILYVKEVRQRIAEGDIEYRYLVSEKGKQLIFDIFYNYTNKDGLKYIDLDETA